MVTINKVLLVGGSDPSGGAGIQADLKTLLELGVYPYTALAAITSQNSSRVSAREPVTARMLKDQINLLLEDGPIQGLKTGMLGSSENILEVVRLISEQNIKYSIVDPVIRAGDGSMLASDASIAVLRKRLIPACFMVTPNIVEAQILTGVHIANEDDILKAAKALKETGVKWVLIKGGHLNSDMAIDLLYDGVNEYFFETKKIESKNVRGTGCMMASAVCAFLVRGLSPEEAVDKAKAYVFSKILRAVPLGNGSLQAVHGALQTLLASPQTTVGASRNATDAHDASAVQTAADTQNATDVQNSQPSQHTADTQNADAANDAATGADAEQNPAENDTRNQSVSVESGLNDANDDASDAADNAAEQYSRPEAPEAITIDSISGNNYQRTDTSLDEDLHDDSFADSDETPECEGVDESNIEEDECDNSPLSVMPARNDDESEGKNSRGTTYVAISADSIDNEDGKRHENADDNKDNIKV
jgi:hydroxymethylpyrimidine kinase/phosphomethylpyrimidine kinase